MSRTSSDTESDSGNSQVECSTQTFCLPDCAVPDEITSSVMHRITEGVQESVSCILGVQLEDIENQGSATLERIYRASTAILDLLDAIVSSTDACVQLAETYVALHALLQINFLEQLFHLRHFFRNIAALETGSGSSKSSVICWVDVVLARLGDAVVTIVENDHSEPAAPFTSLKTLSKHRDETSLRAALQLPQTWSDTISDIASDYTSPAATRLAVCLTFAAYVLAFSPQIQRAELSWPSHGPTPDHILKVLRTFIQRTPLVDRLAQEEHRREERLTYAMIISIYAVVDSVRSTRLSSPLRPHTRTILLSLIGLVMTRGTSNTTVTSLHVVDNLDAAQSVLLRWSPAVPWTWTLWDEERILDYNIIESLTTTWLYHLDERPYLRLHNYEDLLMNSLAKDPAAGSYIINILLSRAASSYASPCPPSSHNTLEAIRKCCWGACRLLEVWRDQDHSLSRSICEAFVCLFILLPQGDEEVKVKNIIVEGLTYIHQETIHDVVSSCCRKTSLRLKLENGVTTVMRNIKRLNAESSEELWRTRHLLQFLVLAWQAGVAECVHGQSASVLMKTVVYCLSNKPCNSLFSVALLETLLTALTLFETVGLLASPEFEKDAVWDLAMEAGPTNITVLSSFACYSAIAMQTRKFDKIALVEAWGLLRGFVLLVNRRYFFAVDEPLSLLVCPAIFRAMEIIIERSGPATTSIIRSSPWTASLCDALQATISNNGSTEYDIAVRDVISGPASMLFHRLMNKLHPDKGEPLCALQDIKYRLMCLGPEVGPSLLLVC